MEWSNGVLECRPAARDPYWGTMCNKDGFEAATVYNQNDFKKFCKQTLCEDGRYDLENIRTNEYVWWSPERYPREYPCKVQFWSHFEGSMLYLGIEYIKDSPAGLEG